MPRCLLVVAWLRVFKGLSRAVMLLQACFVGRRCIPQWLWVLNFLLRVLLLFCRQAR